MNQLTEHIGLPNVNGRIGLWRIREPGKHGIATKIESIFFKPNQIQYDWGYIAAQCIGKGDKNYRLRTLYIEYENQIVSSSSAGSEGGISPPPYDRQDGIEYYQDLVMSSNRDFLRVPLLVEPSIGIETGFEDFFTADEEGNKLTFYTQTQGTSGFHGKPFSHTVNSTVFGAALVATPDFQDQTKDVIFARTYFDIADQEVKQVSSQFGLTWEISFE